MKPSRRGRRTPRDGRASVEAHRVGSDDALALAAGVLDRATADHTPVTDDRDPADALAAMVEHVLALADTWTAWDGRVFPINGRIYTPHKAIRRVADHLVDHLAQMEARLAGDAFHLTGSAYYADAVGDLTPAEQRQS